MMRPSIVRNISAAVLLGCLTVSISGCGKSVSGVYADDSNTISIEFKSGGKATVTIAGSPNDATYSVSGKNVTVSVNGDNKVFTLNDDGSLGGGGETLKKK
jgi:hypothetical protein